MTSVLPEPERPDTCRYLASLSAINQQQQSRLIFEDFGRFAVWNKMQIRSLLPHENRDSTKDCIRGQNSDWTCFTHIDS